MGISTQNLKPQHGFSFWKHISVQLHCLHVHQACPTYREGILGSVVWLSQVDTLQGHHTIYSAYFLHFFQRAIVKYWSKVEVYKHSLVIFLTGCHTQTRASLWHCHPCFSTAVSPRTKTFDVTYWKTYHSPMLILYKWQFTVGFHRLLRIFL